MASLFREQFQTPLVNDSGVRVGAGSEHQDKMQKIIEQNNALNDGRGGAVIKTAEDGSEYISYEKFDMPGIPRYIINGSIVVKCCDKKGEKQSIIVTTTVIDRGTGRAVANSRVAGSGTRMQNYQMLGKKPTLWERFVSGYAREIRYDDMLEGMLQKSAMENAAGILNFDPETSNGRK